MRVTGAQALVRVLRSEQVALAFGVVGGKSSRRSCMRP